MGKTLGYMVTWTTYGTRLQGDKRGWVKDGNTYKVNPCIEEANKEQMQHTSVKLTNMERDLVREAILGKARERRQKIYAINVRTNHVHIVFDNGTYPISQVVQAYKNAATAALRENGFYGKIWTSGYDKRYCFNEKAMRNRIEYVEGQRKARIKQDCF